MRIALRQKPGPQRFPFRRKANRFIRWLSTGKPIVLVDEEDRALQFVIDRPLKQGDEAVIYVEGVGLRRVIWIDSYLVDCGPMELQCA